MQKENEQGTRELLIEAAKKEFLEKGYEGASIRSIGARAGMTSAGLYRQYLSDDISLGNRRSCCPYGK